jgi:hypothetical protein
MNRSTIIYQGAELSVPEFLVDLWPHDLAIEDWPTFCGAGDGPGDWIVPDKARGVYFTPACFIHDIDWALAPSRLAHSFVISNYYFWCNLRALTKIQTRESTTRQKMLLHLNNLYAAVVTTPLGWRNFHPLCEPDWTKNSEVKGKLNKLAMASLEVLGGKTNRSEVS